MYTHNSEYKIAIKYSIICKMLIYISIHNNNHNNIVIDWNN